MINRILQKSLFLYAVALLAIMFFTSTGNTASAVSSKDTDNETIALFKANKFEEIIQTAGNAEQLSEWDKLLLAKSYERLGYFNRANRVLKVLFYQNPDFRYFIPYFVANNYEQLEDYSNALKWYGLMVHSRIQSSEIEKYMFLINTFERIVAIREDDPLTMPHCVRLLKKSLKYYPEASYYLGLIYDKQGDQQKASVFYY